MFDLILKAAVQHKAPQEELPATLYLISDIELNASVRKARATNSQNVKANWRTRMKRLLWTIQNEEAYQEFERTGILRANEDHLFCQDDLRFAYDWICDQMKTRIGPPPVGVRYPIWAWYQWEGKRKRMDQRLSGYAKRGTPLVQITFEAAPGSFLLSDFDRWHIVLANQYVADNEAEWDKFYEVCPHPERSDVEPSWERIFDLTHYAPNWDREPEKKSIQATLWQIEMSQVKKVEHFLAK